MFRRKLSRLLLGLAIASTPLVTAATCDPYTGYFDFYRDDDSYDHDDGFFDGWGWDDDYYEYDDCFDCF